MNRELQLAPARHQAHHVDLTTDEMYLYDRVASAIMNAATRLHRQGVLSSHMAHVMQWVQELCRLRLHPSPLDHYALLRGDLETYSIRGVLPTSDDAAQDENANKLLADSSVASTPQEALEWAKSIAAALKPDFFSSPSVPEETATTLLQCFHMFCKECVPCTIDATRSVAGNTNPKCPYCRNRKSMLGEKRVVAVNAAAPPEAVTAAAYVPLLKW
ncbi:hypothetical protein JKF63_04188 [Porcisia hertigi]|uniref:RING-type domain-containing protein n=1 Tax=Porcisia hertigi TaxID=2761500 RepID=A0A836IJ88_9TRYP|nr:hypothetical protein JKF63_04188 [Porcisia hertigi]